MTKPLTEMNKAELNRLPSLTVEEYEGWRKAQPDSPVPMSLRTTVRGAYALQELRIAEGNRLCAHFRVRLGIEPSEKEDTDVVAKKVLDKLRVEFNKITDGVPGALTSRAFKADGLFHSYTEYVLVAAYIEMEKQEKRVFKSLTAELVQIPVYNEFLEPVAGVGNALSGFLLAELNPYRARHASSFWRYLGLDVHADGTGVSNKKIHNEPTWCRESDGKGGYKMVMSSRKTYNPKAKSKVMGVLAECMHKNGLRWENTPLADWNNTPEPFRRIQKSDVKLEEFPLREWEAAPGDFPHVVSAEFVAGKETENRKTKDKIKLVTYQVAVMKNKYVERYLTYKHRKANSVEMCKVYRKEGKETVLTEIRWCDTTPAHRDEAAKRAMVKTFIADFWVSWRKLEGLPASDPYAEAMLGRAPHHDPNLGNYRNRKSA